MTPLRCQHIISPVIGTLGFQPHHVTALTSMYHVSIFTQTMCISDRIMIQFDDICITLHQYIAGAILPTMFIDDNVYWRQRLCHPVEVSCRSRKKLIVFRHEHYHDSIGSNAFRLASMYDMPPPELKTISCEGDIWRAQKIDSGLGGGGVRICKFFW